VKERFVIWVFILSFSLLFLSLEISAQEDSFHTFIAQMQKSLDEKDIPAYLENFSEDLRAEEESKIIRKFDQFQMESATLFKSGKLSQSGNEAKIYLQALFQNSFSVIIENWGLSLIQVEDRWQVTKKNVIGSISTLYKIKIPSEKVERVKSIEIEHVDIKISFKDALLFYDNIPGLETALLIVGKGRLHYSPSDLQERHQLDLIYKKSFLEDELPYAFLRFSNYFFQDKIKIEKGQDDIQVSEKERNNAYSLFSKHYPQSFTVENSLNRELYSSLPQGDEVVFDLDGKKLGDLTYIYSPFADEEVNFYRWKDEKIINLYSPSLGEKQRRMFVSFGEMFEVKSYKIEIDFNPKQYFISGKARVEVESKVGSLERVKLKLNPKLEILRIHDEQMHELFYSRDKLREFLYIYFIDPPPKERPYTIEIFYRGKIVPPVQVEDVVSGFSPGEKKISFIPQTFDTYLFSRRSYWYPSPADDDYFKAQLRIIVPAGYGCVSIGELIEQTKLNSVERVEEVDKIGSSVYIFEAKNPVKYLSFIVGGFTKVKEDANFPPLKLYASSSIYYQKKGLVEEAKRIVQFYEDKFGPFPYEKLSIIQRSWSSSGGHSSPSFIVLNELPKLEEGEQYVNVRSPVDLSRWREYFIAHEIAHQWWGQGVTWRTYHDQWISEGLSQFAAALYLREKHGEGAFSLILKKFSRWTEKSSRWGPISLGSRISFINYRAYQSIIYNKSSLVLNLLKDLLGEDVFFEGLREFFKNHIYSVASTGDFRKTFEQVSGKDLGAFFECWFDSYTLPEVRVSHSLQKGKDGYILEFRANQPKEIFVLPLWVEWMENGERVKKLLIIDEKNKEFEFEVKDKPKKIRINPDDALPGKFF